MATLLGLTSTEPMQSAVESAGALRTPAEERLIALWQAVLGRSNFGINDELFELGGASISGGQVIARIGDEFQITLPLFRLFRTPTISALAQWLESDEKQVAPDFASIEQVSRPEHLPLAYSQQRLWFLAQMGVSRPYHMSSSFDLNGTLDRAALRRALDRIVERHESLRTTFPVVAGEPVQQIADAKDSCFRLLEHDLRGQNQAQAELRRLMEEEADAPFDLQRGPLVRGCLIQLEDRRHVFVITMHHIVSDGWSMGVLLEELNALYRAYAHDKQEYLPEIRLQYADYALWQRQWMEGDAVRQQAEYWRATLSGAPALLSLPADYERPAQQDYTGAFIEFSLDEKLTAELQELGRKQGTTLFMTLLAGWTALLGRLSGQQDVVVGTPTANRGRSEIENLIGCFINTLAVRVDLSGEPTVGELLQRVKTQALTGQQHQDIPFEQVVELLHPVRTLAHAAVFQVLFAWQNASEAQLELPGVEVQPLPPARVMSKFDLTLTLKPVGQKIIGGATDRETLARATPSHHKHNDCAGPWQGYQLERSATDKLGSCEHWPPAGSSRLHHLHLRVYWQTQGGND